MHPATYKIFQWIFIRLSTRTFAKEVAWTRDLLTGLGQVYLIMELFMRVCVSNGADRSSMRLEALFFKSIW